MFYELNRSNSKNVQKHLGSLFNFIKLQRVKPGSSKTSGTNNYCIAIFMDGTLNACDNEEFEYFDELKRYLIPEVATGIDYYSFTDGYVYAKNFNELKVKIKLEELADLICNEIGKIVALTPYNKEEDKINFDHYSYNLFKTILENYINSFKKQDTNLDNVTFSEYLQIQFAAVTLNKMKTIIELAESGEFDDFVDAMVGIIIPKN